ncbi:hypothetical protein DIC66_05690 [Rhodoferax lacus]|uniref:DUF2282 domain-containing protein n=1 Tax=Rhodoferax lacus TaxID=2184758 RepID=A0A3E1RFP9_9BURK|nr:hypothetical protein [Rhodoferax lacus]RFO98205.1 hypothetical protein DIC66_05690 [Rhodoferax lacus]
MSHNFKTTLAIASAAAALFAMSAPITVAHADDMSVHCAGINSCKGTSDCKTAKNECKGQNSCKGMGWNSKSSAKECTSAGGTVVK